MEKCWRSVGEMLEKCWRRVGEVVEKQWRSVGGGYSKHPHARSHFGSSTLPKAPIMATEEEMSATADFRPRARLRLQNLDQWASVQDVLAFFSIHELADHLLLERDIVQVVNSNLHPKSCTALVWMRSLADAEVAQQKLDGQTFWEQRVEVFVESSVFM